MRDREFCVGGALAGCLIAFAVLMFVFSPPAFAEPAYCGNVNGSGFIDITDLSFFWSALTTCPNIIPMPSDADVDGYTGVSYRDLSVFVYNCFHEPPLPFNCATIPPVYPTSPGTCISVLNDPVTYATSGALTCTLFVRYTDVLHGLTLPVKFFMGPDSATVLGASALLSMPDSLMVLKTGTGGSTVHFYHYAITASPRTWLMAEVDLSVPSTSEIGGRTVRVEYSPLTHCGDPRYDFASPWVFKEPPLFEVITPTLGCSCCAGQRGNINLQGIVDLADLSSLIRYLVADGGGLVCRDAANVNGEGIIDLADLSELIAFLVGGGAPLAACP